MPAENTPQKKGTRGTRGQSTQPTNPGAERQSKREAHKRTVPAHLSTMCQMQAILSIEVGKYPNAPEREPEKQDTPTCQCFGVSGIFRVTNKRPWAWEGGCGDYELRGGEMPREDGYKNLVPLNERTKEEQRSIQQDGGKASGVSRRRKKSLKEAADLFLSLPVTDTRTFNKMAKAGLNTDEIDYQMAVIVGLTLQAAKGDAKAAKTVFELLGDDARVDTNTEDDPLTKAIDEAVNNGLFGEASTNPDIPEDE